MKKILTAIALLGLSNAALASDLGPACTEYFEQIDQFVASNPQGEAMKAQYETAKQQMTQMPQATQEPACKQASDMLKQAMSATPVKK